MSGNDWPILVTGGAGFIGSNLADALAGDGNRVLVYDALSRPGVERNLEWLKSRHGELIEAVIADVRDEDRLAAAAARSQAVFHLAAQVAVTTSLADPREDFAINILGTLHLLDALRTRNPEAPVIFASTNKVYGDLADIEFGLEGDAYAPADLRVRSHGISEDRPLDFHTPYGCSKGAADQYVLDYARSYGLRAAVLRMSCIYGQRQMGTEDQGWVAHFLIRALEGRPITLYGDGRQVRDILDVSNAVEAYVAAWRRIDQITGRAFNLGGGADNAISLLQLLDQIVALLGRTLDVDFAEWRAGDQRYFVADTRAAQAALGLGPKLPWQQGVARLAQWLAAERGLALPQEMRREGVAA
jgi:CDP-paratose 2-epimerase